jgi:hypothetical protein
MSEKVIDIVARLLATENLTVIRDNVRTASFDVVDRVLTMPIFKGMTDVIEEGMVGHEVGHAKHTSWKLIEEANKIDERLPNYFNVTEDVRIEKHMKREFPGLRKSLSGMYKELNAMDFFGVKGKPLDQYNLIDRINLYYKVGFDCGVDFTDEEYDFVVRAGQTESERDALDLAKDIFDYQAQQGTLPPNPPKPPPTAGKGKPGTSDGEKSDEDGEGSGATCEGDDKGSSAKPKDGKDPGSSAGKTATGGGLKGSQFGGGLQSQPGKYMESKTVEAFNKAVSNAAVMDVKYNYHTIVPLYGLHPIVPYTRVLKETASLDPAAQNMRSTINSFKDQSKDDIGFLIKEFEMRKSAEAQKRISVSKTGSLDMRKLHAYALKDDIFRRNSVIPKGKNHGMVFLIDWSGSMMYTIDQVLRQTIDLATFCRRSQIPFEVFAFTTGYLSYSNEARAGTAASKIREGEKLRQSKSKNAIMVGDGRFHLLNLLSGEMTNKEFNTMTDRLLTQKLTGIGGYGLGGTPLNEALIFMTRYLPEFRMKHNLEKLSFITMTDGEGHGVHSFPTTTTIAGKVAKSRHWIRNEQTKVEYEVDESEAGQTHAILQYLKDLTSVTSVGFHIEANSGSYRGAIETMIGRKIPHTESAKLAQECLADIMKNNVYLLNSTSRDLMFIVSNSSLKATNSTLDAISGSTSAAQAATVLTKKMNNRKRNRVLLDKFIQSIA